MDGLADKSLFAAWQQHFGGIYATSFRLKCSWTGSNPQP